MSSGFEIPNRPPRKLAVANIHPDYLETCFELCSTGSRNNCRLPVGTIVLVRRTAGGTTKKTYGVVGVWYFTGRNEPVPRRRFFWPYRWSNRVVCQPLSKQFQTPWCEDFSMKVSDTKMAPKESVHVPGLKSTSLQGTIVTIKDPETAARYIHALLTARDAELSCTAKYGERTSTVRELLQELATEFKSK